MHWITLAPDKARSTVRKATPATINTPTYERILGKDAIVVSIPKREMWQAVKLTEHISRSLWYAASVPFLALVIAVILIFKQDASAAVTIDALGLLAGIVITLGAAVFVYGRMVSRKALDIINARIMLAVNETYGVTMKPATSNDISLRDTFTTGIDNTDAVSSIWKLTIGDDFIRCWRMKG